MKAVAYERDWIEARLPHAGKMCLLDSVVEWDEARIHCRTRSHLAPDNPLRAADRLATACAVEYAAQAAALHAATLRARDAVDAVTIGGMLASVRDLQLLADRLDHPSLEALEVHCTRLAAMAQGLSYEFRVETHGAALALGRLTIALRAPGSAP